MAMSVILFDDTEDDDDLTCHAYANFYFQTMTIACPNPVRTGPHVPTTGGAILARAQLGGQALTAI